MSPASSACSSRRYFDPARRGEMRAVRAGDRWCRCCTSASATTRTRWPKAARTSGMRSRWCRSATASGMTACGWKCSRRATTGPTPPSACACAAAWCGPAIRGRSRKLLAKFADAGELVAHDCALHGNPSHSGIDDLEREYPRELLDALPAVPLRQRRGRRDAAPRAAIASRRPGEVVALERSRRARGRTVMNAVLRPHATVPGRAPRDALRAPAARPAPVGDRGLQLPLPVLHAGRPRAATTTASMRRRACRSTRSRRWCAASSRLGVQQAAPDRRRAAAAQAACPNWSRGWRAIPGIDDLALTTNGSLLARQAQALRDAGLRRITVSLDALDPALFRALSGGRGDVADVLAGIAAARARPASRRSSSTAWCSAASTTTRCCRWSSASRGARPRAALHRVHGRRHLQRLAARARGAFGRAARPHRTRAGRCGRWIRTTAAKSPRATPSPTAAARSASSVRSASRSAATATARACRPTASCTPACSPRDGHDLRPALRAGRGRRWREHVAGAVVAPRRPLQRAARRGWRARAGTSRCS